MSFILTIILFIASTVLLIMAAVFSAEGATKITKLTNYKDDENIDVKSICYGAQNGY